jgi:hypothetical protein
MITTWIASLRTQTDIVLEAKGNCAARSGGAPSLHALSRTKYILLKGVELNAGTVTAAES